MIPYNFIRIEDGVFVYKRSDVDLFGMPDLWGVEDYIVVSTEDDVAPQVMDWQMIQDRRGSLRPIHRYDRVSRFRSLLNDFMGNRNVPEEVVELVRFWGLDDNGAHVFEGVRKVLKAYGYRKYYNSIPSIIWMLRGGRRRFESRIVEQVMDDFIRMSFRFDRLETDRSYFPNLRYVLLELLELNGFDFGFDVVKIRTKRKRVVMENIFEVLY